MDLERVIQSEVNQEEKNRLMHIESKKMVQINLFTKHNYETQM